jgi:hypothetical protein
VDARRDPRDGPDARRQEASDARSAAPSDELVRFACVSGPHQTIGPTQPDGSGHLTLRDGAWASCAAGRAEEPHTWADIAPRPLFAIRHSDPLQPGTGTAM